jgi:hypothetical protein
LHGKEAQSFSGKSAKKAANAWQSNGDQSSIARSDAKAEKVAATKARGLEHEEARADKHIHRVDDVVNVQTKRPKTLF